MCDYCQMTGCPYYRPGESCYYDDCDDDRLDGMGEFDFEAYQGYY